MRRDTVVQYRLQTAGRRGKRADTVPFPRNPPREAGGGRVLLFHLPPTAGPPADAVTFDEIEQAASRLLRADEAQTNAQCMEIAEKIYRCGGGSAFMAKSRILVLLLCLYQAGGPPQPEPGALGNFFQMAEGCSDAGRAAAVLARYIRRLRPAAQKHSCLVETVLRYLEEHYAEEVTLKKVAEQFKISPNYLCSILRKETGETLKKLLTKLRLREAKRMLKDPTMRVNEICEAVGYGDYIYFYKLFKKNEGCAPLEYRNL